LVGEKGGNSKAEAGTRRLSGEKGKRYYFQGCIEEGFFSTIEREGIGG